MTTRKFSDFVVGTIGTIVLMACAYVFDANSRSAERAVITVEHEKVVKEVVIQHKEVLVENERVIEGKQKEVNNVAKQRDNNAKERDEALKEVARIQAELEQLKSSGNAELDRMRQQLLASQAQAAGSADAAERTKRLAEKQGQLLASCGAETIELAKRADRLTAEVRELREQWPTVNKLK
jgi:hypothetical protein